MKLSDKYTSKTANEPKKKIISDDAYAICEFLEELTNKLKEASNRL